MVYERNLLDFIPNKAKLCIIKLILMRMKILLGLMLCFLGIQIYRKTVEQKKLLKKFLNGPQPIMIKVLNKSLSFRKRYSFFQLDDSVAELCFLGEVLINGISYKATIIAPSQTNVGETYIMNGYYYPSSRLFIPSNDNIYTYKVRKYFIPYLFPKAIMYRKSSNF